MGKGTSGERRCPLSERARLNFETPKFDYDELEQQLRDYQPDLDQYPHDTSSIISIEQAIRAGRMGNVAVGGCLLHHDKVILRDVSQAFRSMNWLPEESDS
jgi:tRNA(adenine34) deaminase